MNTEYRIQHSGLSLVGVIVASALMLIIFSGLFAAIVLALDIVSNQKAEAGAVALANERIEYIRSLPYNTVGTVGGIVPGPLPQTSTTSLNGVAYTERILVNYVDDAADGLLGSDSNGITSDYKVVKVEYAWNQDGATSTRTIISNVVPPGMETTIGGGTLVVNVFDATVQPVESAAVRVVNNTTTSTIDTTVFTNTAGQAILPGAPAAASYQVEVTKSGYSTDATYSATSSNPNPNPPHVAVIESGVSTVGLSIDELSDLTFQLRTNPVLASFVDTFSDSSLLDNSSSTEVSGGSLVLTNTAGSFDLAGSAFATMTAPSTIERWLSFNAETAIPPTTDARVQLYWVSSGGAYTLVNDSDVPGNSTGFTGGVIDISHLATSTYPRLALGASLLTSDVATTSRVLSWGIDYEVADTPIAGVQVDIVGDKIIGTNASASPIRKYSGSEVSDASGSARFTDLEWDLYEVSIDGPSEGYDIAEACENIPYPLNPGVSETVLLTLEPHVNHSLRVAVVDGTSEPIPGASVRVARAGLDQTRETSVCGQAFFNSGLGSFIDYEITVTADGYVVETIDPFTVDGTSYLQVTLSEL